MIDISLPNLLLAGTVVETLTVILVYFNNNKGKYITKWYNNLRIGAILLDILSAIVPVLFALLINNNLHGIDFNADFALTNGKHLVS